LVVFLHLNSRSRDYRLSSEIGNLRVVTFTQRRFMSHPVACERW
jgi:hypothetical protein